MNELFRIKTCLVGKRDKGGLFQIRSFYDVTVGKHPEDIVICKYVAFREDYGSVSVLYGKVHIVGYEEDGDSVVPVKLLKEAESEDAVVVKPAEETRKHFPNIYHKCLTIGIDITTDYIPVRPAAHYMCGGIKVDLNGCSSISRLYAIGECSCTGLHGGNRLASNSLIEAVVYAETAARHSLAHVDEYDFNTLVPEWNDEGTMTNEEKVLITQSVKEVGEIMANYVGIVRSNLRLQRAWTRLDVLYEETEKLFKRVKATRDICELRNMINTAYLITRWAIERKECRGLHYTTDYPHK